MAHHYDRNFAVITDDRFVRELIADIAEFESAGPLLSRDEGEYLEAMRDCIRYRRALLLMTSAMPAALQHDGQYPKDGGKDSILFVDVLYLEDSLRERMNDAQNRMNRLHERLSGSVVGRKRAFSGDA